TALAASYRLDQAPHATPDLAHGRALYEKLCATCHGMTGQADTPTAATLRPKPVAFRRSLFGDAVSPYDVTTAIQFGIGGTSMAAQPSLSEKDRWDIAFYVLGFPHPGPMALDAPNLTLAELARVNDEALRAELLAGGIARVDAEPVIAALRRRIP